MGKHNKKTGRERLDKYYQMAKSQGYRARSSFKLVHLNRKYDLLAKSRVVIDLCAAPGGWLQVAQKYCPQQSLIVGVDLDAIRPIPGVHTFVGDITTQECRTSLKGYLKHFQADLVLHDGAPNVGTAWIQDAFNQSELTLLSLKLATEFLKKGGAFVTKVFRSGDYNSLMWVFNQLFGKVEATKPPSSRNVSAEIFVVCQDFLAPKYIDPKFLDPKHVFKELSNSSAPLPLSITLDPSATAVNGSTQPTTNGATNSGASLALNGTTNIFAPEKKRRAREGYAEGDYTLYRTLPVRSLVYANGLEAVTVLSSCNALEWAPKGEEMGEEEEVWFESRHTDDEIKQNMQDLRVLGKGEFRKLMKWRLAIRLQVGLDVKSKEVEEDTEGKVTIEEPVDEEAQVSEEMQKLHAENLIKARRLKKRQNEKKARTIQRLQLGMTAPEDMVLDGDAALAGEDMFDLGTGENEVRRKGVKGKGLADLVKDTDGMDEEDVEESEEEEEDDEYLSSEDEREAKTAYLGGELDGLYDAYKERMHERDAKWKVRQARLQDRNRDAWHGIRNEDEDGENDGIVKVQGHGVGQNGLEAGVDEGEESEEGGWDLVASHKAKIGEEVDSDDDSDSEHSGDEEGAPRVKRVRLALPGHATSAAAAKAMAMASQSKKNLVTNLGADVEQAEMSRQAQVWFDQSIFKDVGDLADLDEGEEEEEEEEEDSEDEDMESGEESDIDMAEADMDGSERGEDDFEVVPVQEDDGMQWDVENEDEDEIKKAKIQKKGLLTAEAVTLATALVNRKLTADQMIDDGFNKHNFNHKDGLPTWFLDDEGKYYKPNLPVTKEAIQALRAKQRALDARPIKKVAEAKARKKFKAAARMEKAKRKMDGLTDAPDMSERDKAQQMQKLLGKAAGKPKKKEVSVVVAKGVNRGVKGRPKGVKGRYKIVDPRMRKEVRALKRIAKRDKKRKH